MGFLNEQFASTREQNNVNISMFCKVFCLYISVGILENMIEFIATEKLIKDVIVKNCP